MIIAVWITAALIVDILVTVGLVVWHARKTEKKVLAQARAGYDAYANAYAVLKGEKIL